MIHAGGLAKTIADAAGPELTQYCNTKIYDQGQVETGHFISSKSFNLKQYLEIIHLVGPIFNS